MTEESREQIEQHKALFLNLVVMLTASVMQQLGKVMNPLTHKIEVDLKGAEATIDMLDMLEAKTRGNLDADEDRVMKDTLSAVRLNYVETKEHPPAPAEPAPAEKTQTPPAPAGEQQDTVPKTTPNPPKDPKYHKSYG